MATIIRFEDIVSWKEARELNKIIGTMIDQKRFKINFRLINQIEGSAGSIMDNIAEGFERSGNKEFVHFLFMAKGSAGELRAQLYVAVDLKYIGESEFAILSESSESIARQLSAFIKYLQRANGKT